MREQHLLQDRIELLGPVRHRDVQDVSRYNEINPGDRDSYSLQVLVRGSIFLNTSLTESFGIAILEAACAGLYVVSTRVGGVPEILPKDMISFARPEEDGACRVSFSGPISTHDFLRLDPCDI
jgi:phosphatidylinositol glycan class A protein